MKPPPDLTTWLPGLLIGRRVKVFGGRGVIIELGHYYGPGSGQDQARLRFCQRIRWHGKWILHRCETIADLESIQLC